MARMLEGYHRNYYTYPGKGLTGGEQMISNLLSELRIYHASEVNFPFMEDKRKRYDFYLPDYDLVIEYDGPYHQNIDQIMRDAHYTHLLLTRGISILRVAEKSVRWANGWDYSKLRNYLYDILSRCSMGYKTNLILCDLNQYSGNQWGAGLIDMLQYKGVSLGPELNVLVANYNQMIQMNEMNNNNNWNGGNDGGWIIIICVLLFMLLAFWMGWIKIDLIRLFW